MQNMFIGKGNLGDSPELKRVNGRNGEFVVASMRVMFARWGQNDQGDLEQIGGFLREQRVMGFNTYGEQFNGMHINQTFTGVAIARGRR